MTGQLEHHADSILALCEELARAVTTERASVEFLRAVVLELCRRRQAASAVPPVVRAGLELELVDEVIRGVGMHAELDAWAFASLARGALLVAAQEYRRAGRTPGREELRRGALTWFAVLVEAELDGLEGVG